MRPISSAEIDYIDHDHNLRLPLFCAVCNYRGKASALEKHYDETITEGWFREFHEVTLLNSLQTACSLIVNSTRDAHLQHTGGTVGTAPSLEDSNYACYAPAAILRCLCAVVRRYCFVVLRRRSFRPMERLNVCTCGISLQINASY